jgi:hypothetical protein
MIAFIILYRMKNQMDTHYFVLLMAYLVVGLFYFRCIIFSSASFLFNTLIFLILLFAANFYIAYIFSSKFYYYLGVIEDYSIHFSADFITPLAKNLNVQQILAIKNMTVFGFIFSLFILLLTQIRIIWLLMRRARTKFAGKDRDF